MRILTFLVTFRNRNAQTGGADGRPGCGRCGASGERLPQRNAPPAPKLAIPSSDFPISAGMEKSDRKGNCPHRAQVVLSIEEWNEIEDSVIGLHASISCGMHDENEELLKAVYIRLAFALRPIRDRLGS